MWKGVSVFLEAGGKLHQCQVDITWGDWAFKMASSLGVRADVLTMVQYPGLPQSKLNIQP